MQLLTSKSRLFQTGSVPLLIAITACLVLSGCAPPSYNVVPEGSSRSASPVAETRLYFYPLKGQSKAQQDRDRYECHLWAVKQTGFDPGQAALTPNQRVRVESNNAPGANTAAGAFGGAVVGSMLSEPDDEGEGMVLGAITGAMLGASADQAQQQQQQALQNHYNRQYSARNRLLQRKINNYRRAMTACLEGRGYSVQ